jgi:CBS domain-containing protein/sugar-specific transcriptional regulator TrmB
VAKFSVISGKKKIHAKMLNMIGEAEKAVYFLTTSIGVIQEDLDGIFDALLENSHKHKDFKFKIIADISKDNLEIMASLDKRISAENTDIECRHLNLNSRFFPRFLIKDEEDAILYATSENEVSVLHIEDEGLWINDKMFVSILKAFFVQMWQTSVEAYERIDELKTGVPLGETLVIKDAKEARQKMDQLLDAATEDVVLITSSQSLNSIVENDPFAKHRKQGLKYRIMAPIDLDNLDAAKKLLAHYEVKHVPINYMTMMLIDDKNLFMFKTPPLSDLADESFYLAETFYTNDPRTSEHVSEMLNDTWKRGTDIAEITSQAGMKLPTVNISLNEKVSNLVKAVLQSNVNSVLITDKGHPIGIINDRDLLKEIFENKKDPEKALVKDVNYTPLVTMEAGKSMTDALKIMREKGTKRIAVVKNGQLMGMLTQDLAVAKQDKRKAISTEK